MLTFFIFVQQEISVMLYSYIIYRIWIKFDIVLFHCSRFTTILHAHRALHVQLLGLPDVFLAPEIRTLRKCLQKNVQLIISFAVQITNPLKNYTASIIISRVTMSVFLNGYTGFRVNHYAAPSCVHHLNVRTRTSVIRYLAVASSHNDISKVIDVRSTVQSTLIHWRASNGPASPE